MTNFLVNIIPDTHKTERKQTMTFNQAANAILDMYKTLYRVVDAKGETVVITNTKEQASLMAQACNGDFIAIES